VLGEDLRVVVLTGRDDYPQVGLDRELDTRGLVRVQVLGGLLE
jgi:hypothetical protein